MGLTMSCVLSHLGEGWMGGITVIFMDDLPPSTESLSLGSRGG